MRDPSFSQAVELVDQICIMPIGEASRYVFERYRSASPGFREAIVLALAGALCASIGRAAALKETAS